MVRCAECAIWYHFGCIDLREADAEEINVYVCPVCTKLTGRRTAMLWEGHEAVEVEDESALLQPPKKKATKQRPVPEPKDESLSESEPSSEDEYVEESKKLKKSAVGKRNVGRVSIANVSDSERSDDDGGSHSNASTPGPIRLKRKNKSAADIPVSKRHKSSTPAEDPVRKYCLAKLEELFRDIFLRYPHVRVKHEQEEHAPEQEQVEQDIQTKLSIISKNLEELSEEEKEALIQEANHFAYELEHCIFDIYHELDKLGEPHAGGKYKDRFRTLQFNLSKFDRVVIHQRITSANISPKELSLMSSTDLADEETKQNIKIAEKEALEHSILQRQTAPRAKITHKGLQDIEAINGETASARELERQQEREQEEEERRERERMARLRATQRQRTSSLSIPPESPIVLQTPTSESSMWGGPPPESPMSVVEVAGIPSTIYTRSQEVAPPEPELNLADLINIDDDLPPNDTITMANSPSHMDAMSPVDAAATTTGLAEASAPVSSTPTGISPFASRPDGVRSSSFDLNALWSGPVASTVTSATPEPLGDAAIASPIMPSEQKDTDMEHETLGEANDQDFDMFLDDKEPEVVVSAATESAQDMFNSTPQVWSGKISMPLDSTVPQETPVMGRQMGGRSIQHDSLLWKTLFPSDTLRIDGRVAVENSSKFLLQIRMNPHKELIGAAFTPASEEAEHNFKALSDFLIGKGRHGLVFPWGNRAKEHLPGRELYIIPLLSTEPLPEYMELLDELKLPKLRNVNYLIGIWVLNRGKLAPPPAPPSQPTPSSATPPLSSIPQFSTPPPLIPATPANSNPLSAGFALPNIPGISQAALAAEVATLTPDQIHALLQTLSIPPSVPVSVPPLNSSAPIPPHIPVPPVPLHQPPPSGWAGTPSHGYYPPVPIQNTPPQHSLTPPVGYSTDDRHSGDSTRLWGPGPGARGGRNDRGGRNNDRRGRSDYGRHPGPRSSRGRGVGPSGRGRDGNHSPQRSMDTGWPRRPPPNSDSPVSPTRPRW
ncbi:hypothetical protein BDQ17DRAFT_1352832 [Cyathus striatus]|nr:hypothetical protein BDQ17DRAFT_1352832 [Cyathus striatus]